MFTEKFEKSILDNLKFFRIRDQPKIERHTKMRLKGDELVALSIKDNGKKVIKIYQIQLNFMKMWTIDLKNEEIIDFEHSNDYLFVVTDKNFIHIYKNEEYEFLKKLELNENISTINIVNNTIYVGFASGKLEVYNFINFNKLYEVSLGSKINNIFYFNNIFYCGLENGFVDQIIVDNKNYKHIKYLNTKEPIIKLLVKNNILYILNAKQNLEIFKDNKWEKQHNNLNLDSSMMIIYLQYLIIGSIKNKCVYFFNIDKDFVIARRFKLYQDVVSFCFGLDIIFVYNDKPRSLRLYKVIEKNLLDRFFIRFEKFNKEKLQIENKVNTIKKKNNILNNFYNDAKKEYDTYQEKYSKKYEEVKKKLE